VAETGHDASVGDSQPDGLAPRLAIYAADALPPQVEVLERLRLPEDLDRLSRRVQESLNELGGRVPPDALREILDNLVHARFCDVVISLSDGGNTVRVSDRGPGILDKERAFRPGFSTADPDSKAFIRGVGAGLAIARSALVSMGGQVELDDNLGRGTVVTLTVPPLPEAPVTMPSFLVPAGFLSDRQLQMLLLIVELGPVGPTRLAEELKISPSTAYREARVLDSAGLLVRDKAGRRSATEAGLGYLEQLM
jgi:hypothetical protein